MRALFNLGIIVAICLACSFQQAMANDLGVNKIYRHEIRGPHCDQSRTAVMKLDRLILETAQSMCVERGFGMPTSQHYRYTLHAVVSEWQHYKRAIARDISITCPLHNHGDVDAAKR